MASMDGKKAREGGKSELPYMCTLLCTSSEQEWYFVTKIVLTYSEKKLF